MAFDKNRLAPTPPMGWNSWDCYGASVTEEEIRANAQYMARHMKAFGWEYIVCDIQWYEPGATGSAYRPFVPLEMDAYSRLLPAPNRFPSAKGGKGFAPLAEYIHSLGLKFGIHILRGIPRQAVHGNCAILGTEATARDIAHPFSLCSWNTDMYGVNPHSYGASRYYDSLFELYAAWGVDYVKVDDISYTAFSPHTPYSAREEIELIHQAICRCGRDIVLSLSPGPAPLEEAAHLSRFANLWRITGDYWDRWEDLYEMFHRCHLWQGVGAPGSWPDCDMLPIGHIGIRSEEHGRGDRWTAFTQDEQQTMFTLWCLFRSPLMVGGELRDNDPFTLSLLTNPEVLALLNSSRQARQLFRCGEHIAWAAQGENCSYVALFNAGSLPAHIEVTLETLGLSGTQYARDLWARQDLGPVHGNLHKVVPPHGAWLVKLVPQENG